MEIIVRRLPKVGRGNWIQKGEQKCNGENGGPTNGRGGVGKRPQEAAIIKDCMTRLSLTRERV